MLIGNPPAGAISPFRSVINQRSTLIVFLATETGMVATMGVADPPSAGSTVRRRTASAELRLPISQRGQFTYNRRGSFMQGRLT